MSANIFFNKNIINYINRKSRPLSMSNIFKYKRPMSKDNKSNFILNFINYSNKERTIYKKMEKMPLLKKNNLLRNRKIIISDEKYREKEKENILTKFEASENAMKKNNENFIKITRENFDTINNINKNLQKQRRAQSINKDSLINRRKKLQDLIQKKINLKREILFNIEENQKFLEHFNKKGEGINFDEQIKLYKEAKALLDKDTDLIRFFNVLSNIKEEEYKNEFDKIKNSNDKNKEGLISKILEEIRNNKWNINSEFIEKLEKEIG